MASQQTLYDRATNPAAGAVAVSPNDSTDLTYKPTRGLYVGGAGNVVVIMSAGDQVTFTAVAAGQILPIMVTRVLSTNTTATSILALY